MNLYAQTISRLTRERNRPSSMFIPSKPPLHFIYIIGFYLHLFSSKANLWALRSQVKCGFAIKNYSKGSKNWTLLKLMRLSLWPNERTLNMCSISLFNFCLFVYFWGLYLVLIRDYFWLCIQELLLTRLGCWGSNLGWPQATRALPTILSLLPLPYLFYFLSFPSHILSLPQSL